MQFNSVNTKHKFAIIYGIIAGLAGLLLISAYILKAVIERAGEADQSLLFWYLPFLIIGVIILIMGISLSIWGISGKRKNQMSRDQTSDVGPVP